MGLWINVNVNVIGFLQAFVHAYPYRRTDARARSQQEQLKISFLVLSITRVIRYMNLRMKYFLVVH